MSKITEAIAIFVANLVLFSLIILSVRLPVNILSQIIILNLPPSANELRQMSMEFRLDGLLSTIFDPIYIGAMIHCLWQMKRERSYDYSQAMKAGINNWGKLCTARFIAGLFIGLGTILFIIPGIILALRYSLIDGIVIIEGYGKSSRVLKRSSELTNGRKLDILVVTIVASILTLILIVLINIPFALLQIEGNMFSQIITSSLGDIIIAIFTIIMFLFYWEAKIAEPNT